MVCVPGRQCGGRRGCEGRRGGCGRRWGGVVEGRVGTAGVFVGDWLFVFPLCGFSLSLFCNYTENKRRSSKGIVCSYTRLFSTFSGLVVSARFAHVHVDLATTDCTSFRAISAVLGLFPKRLLALTSEATTASWTATTVPASRDALFSHAEVSARCRLCSGDCGLLASSKPLTLAVGEAGGQLRLSRTTREVVGTCGCRDVVTALKRAFLRGIALSTRVKQPSYTEIAWGLCGSMLIRFSTVWLLPSTLL